LGLGANDYVAKPFNPVELAARVRAHLLRYKTLSEQSVAKPSILRFKDLEIDINARETKLNNSRIDLSVFTIEELFEKIWGYDNDADCRTVTVHLGKLRKKIEQDPSSPHYIVNVRGVGYKLKTN